jgi:hypothetical protein
MYYKVIGVTAREGRLYYPYMRIRNEGWLSREAERTPYCVPMRSLGITMFRVTKSGPESGDRSAERPTKVAHGPSSPVTWAQH